MFFWRTLLTAASCDLPQQHPQTGTIPTARDESIDEESKLLHEGARRSLATHYRLAAGFFFKARADATFDAGLFTTADLRFFGAACAACFDDAAGRFLRAAVPRFFIARFSGSLYQGMISFKPGTNSTSNTVGKACRCTAASLDTPA